MFLYAPGHGHYGIGIKGRSVTRHGKSSDTSGRSHKHKKETFQKQLHLHHKAHEVSEKQALFETENQAWRSIFLFFKEQQIKAPLPVPRSAAVGDSTLRMLNNPGNLRGPVSGPTNGNYWILNIRSSVKAR
jgi:hypothetical protein|uniref:Uncharacterized protein n=1 Tax=Mus musculus TaxID=10090 RepID=Q8C967_MOUSE|nr:unnamed protein product [Mus musculus]